MNKETDLQEDERHTEKDEFNRAGRIRLRQLMIDPVQYEKESRKSLEKIKTQFEARGMFGAGNEYTFDFTVDFTKDYWKKTRSEKQIAKDIADDVAELRSTYGIEPVAGTTPAFTEFTEQQAKDIAKLLMVHYVRAILEYGGVSAVNVGAAEKILRDHPEYISILMEEHEDGSEKAKKELRKMIEELKGITGKECELNFKSTKEEYERLEKDLKPSNFHRRDTAIPPSAAIKYDFESDFIKARHATSVELFNSGEATQVKKDATEKKAELGKDLSHYRKISERLERIYAQIKRVPELEWSDTGASAGLFNNAGVLQADKLTGKTNPGLIADEITASLKELEEKEHAHGEKHGHKKAPRGAKAVIEVYKKDLMERHKISEASAESVAIQNFFSSEPTLQENEQLEKEIFHKTGGRLTLTRGIAKGAVSALKGLVDGSNEEYICSIAESPEVQVPMSTGTAATTIRHKVLEAGTWGAVGAGLGYAGLASSAAAPAWVAATLGITAFPPAAVAAGVGIVGYGAFKGFSYLMRKAGPNWRWLDLDRKLFGTRQLGYLWRRWGARPAWAHIADDRLKLKIVWDAMLEGIKQKKLDGQTWYVQSQLMEVGRLLLQNLLAEMGEDAQLNGLSSEEWDTYTVANKRAELQRQISELVQNGAAALGGGQFEALVSATAKTTKYASDQKGGWQKSVAHWWNKAA